MIPLRRGVRSPNRGPFASLPLSYFLLQTYCKSSFEDCNSLPKILQRVPRKSYWARLNRYSIACFDEFSADISSKELSSSRITVDGFLRRRSYKKSSLSQNLIWKNPRKIVLVSFSTLCFLALDIQEGIAFTTSEWRQSLALTVSDGRGRETKGQRSTSDVWWESG